MERVKTEVTNAGGADWLTWSLRVRQKWKVTLSLLLLWKLSIEPGNIYIIGDVVLRQKASRSCFEELDHVEEVEVGFSQHVQSYSLCVFIIIIRKTYSTSSTELISMFKVTSDVTVFPPHERFDCFLWFVPDSLWFPSIYVCACVCAWLRQQENDQRREALRFCDMSQMYLSVINALGRCWVTFHTSHRCHSLRFFDFLGFSSPSTSSSSSSPSTHTQNHTKYKKTSSI